MQIILFFKKIISEPKELYLNNILYFKYIKSWLQLFSGLYDRKYYIIL